MLRRLGYKIFLGMALPGVSFALGLGDIRVESALHQPLAAQIEIVGVTSENSAGLSAEIADEEMFRRHGLERPVALTSTSVAVRQDKQGHAVLVLRSTDVFTEPMVTFLVDLHSPSGEVVREYTVFLDPAGFSQEPGAVGSASAQVANAQPTSAQVAGAQPLPEGTTQTLTPVLAVTSERHETAESVQPATNTYTVARRDTLARIATIAGAHSRSDRRKMMVAIYRANPAAFQTNLNKLRTGAKLHLPNAAELAQISMADANHEFAAQMSAWRAPDHRAASAATGATATKAATIAAGNTAPNAATFSTAGTARTSAPNSAGAAAPSAAGPSATTTISLAPVADPKADADAREIEAREAEAKALTKRVASLEHALDELKQDLRQPPVAEATAPIAAAVAPVTAEATEQFHSAEDAPAPVRHRSLRIAPIAVSLGLALAAGIWLYFFRRRRADESDVSWSRVERETVRRDPKSYRADSGETPLPFPEIDRSASYLVEETQHDLEHVSTNTSAGAPASASEAPQELATPVARTVGFDISDTAESDAALAALTALAADAADATSVDNTAPAFDPTVKLPAQRVLDVETTAILALQAEVDDDTAAREFAFFNPESAHDTTHVTLASGLEEAPKPFVERRKSAADALRQAIEREPDRNDLRLKLLELYYQGAAQNRRAFLDAVRQLAKNDKFSSPNDWAQIEDMGRAIAPDDDLFSNGRDNNKKAVA